MYYRGHPGTDWTKSVTCYAESHDGKVWTKPNLGLVEVRGTRDNNAILPTGEAFGPFLDGRPGVPQDERFKANMNARGGLMGYVSGDGIHWRKLKDELLIRSSLPNHFDSQNVMFWSDAEQCYLLYARHMVGGKRATARATSPDFVNWSDFTLMTYSDTQSTLFLHDDSQGRRHLSDVLPRPSRHGLDQVGHLLRREPRGEGLATSATATV